MYELLVTIGKINIGSKDIQFLINHGITDFRFNLARGYPPNILAMWAEFIQNTKGYHPDIRVYVDLPGKKFRVGRLGGSFQVDQNAELKLVEGTIQTVSNEIPVLNSYFFKCVEAGDIVTLFSSTIVLECLQKADNFATFRVLREGSFKDYRHFGIQKPYSPYTQLCEIDLAYIKELNRYKFDYLILSFCDAPEIVTQVRKIVVDPHLKILAKLESPLALIAVDDIMAVADGIMIGRDDLSRFIDIREVNNWVMAYRKPHELTDRLFITASGYFKSLRGNSDLSNEDWGELQALRGTEVDMVCSNETSYYPNWHDILDVYERLKN